MIAAWGEEATRKGRNVRLFSPFIYTRSPSDRNLSSPTISPAFPYFSSHRFMEKATSSPSISVPSWKSTPFLILNSSSFPSSDSLHSSASSGLILPSSSSTRSFSYTFPRKISLPEREVFTMISVVTGSWERAIRIVSEPSSLQETRERRRHRRTRRRRMVPF